jgi:hypothetical protein
LETPRKGRGQKTPSNAWLAWGRRRRRRRRRRRGSLRGGGGNDAIAGREEKSSKRALTYFKEMDEAWESLFVFNTISQL